MLRKGTKVKFSQMSNLTGKEMTFSGTVIGHAAEIRKLWPVEADEVSDPFYLVLVKDVFGNNFRHMVNPEEIVTEKSA